MKVKIEFNLPEDVYSMRQSVEASEAWRALDDLRNAMRNHYKYGQTSDDTISAVNEILSDVRWIEE